MTNQIWNPQEYRKSADFVPKLGEPVIELLEPKAGERILDLGCGTGILTKKLADMGYTAVFDMGGIIDWPYETESGNFGS